MSIFVNEFYGKQRLTPKQILSDPVLCLAFGFGSGLAKKAPGTFCTLAAVPLYLLMAQTPGWIYGLITLAVCASGVWLCDRATEKLWEHDFGGIVWDEIAGLLLTLWIVPFSWTNLLIGFVLFRLFDITKPWPICWLDRHIHGGLGIMLDDWVAAAFAAAVLAQI